jgi:hypothetical protein
MHWSELTSRANRSTLQSTYGQITDECWLYLDRLMQFEAMENDPDWIEILGRIVQIYPGLSQDGKEVIAGEIEGFDGEDDLGEEVYLRDWLETLIGNLDELIAEKKAWEE